MAVFCLLSFIAVFVCFFSLAENFGEGGGGADLSLGW